MWTANTQAASGEYLLLVMTDGYDVDLFGGKTDAEILQRVNSVAQGWRATHIQQERGVFGVGSTFRIFGQATVNVSTDAVAAQAEAAVNSFWSIGGARFSAMVSRTLAPVTGGSEWSSTLQIVALAVIVVGVVWSITQLRKAFTE